MGMRLKTKQAETGSPAAACFLKHQINPEVIDNNFPQPDKYNNYPLATLSAGWHPVFDGDYYHPDIPCRRCCD
jgi:hypothetical protein